MSRFIKSCVKPNFARRFAAIFGVIFVMLASAPWGTAFAWEPEIDLLITTVDPGWRGSQFNGHSDEFKMVIAYRTSLSGGALESSGVNAEDKVNLVARRPHYETADIGSVRLELTGAQTVSRTDNTAPYTLFEDFIGQALPAGIYQLSVTPYSETDLDK